MIKDYLVVEKAMASCPWTITQVVSGNARGVDRLGEMWAHNCRIPVKKMPANWDLHGKAAGPIRNSEMADYASEEQEKGPGGLVLIWDGSSSGGKDILTRAKQRGLSVHEVIVKPELKRLS